MAPKSKLSTFRFIHLKLRGEHRGGGWNSKYFTARHRHLPGFLGITILVAGSACQPWLTTPLGERKEQKGGVSPPTTVKGFQRGINSITACGNVRTFNRLLHRVAHKSSKVFGGDGRVSLSHQTVRSLPRALCEYQQHVFVR